MIRVVEFSAITVYVPGEPEAEAAATGAGVKLLEMLFERGFCVQLNIQEVRSNLNRAHQEQRRAG